MLMSIEALTVLAGEEESDTCATKLAWLAAVGIPVMEPDELSDRPVGSAPEEMVHL